MGPLTSVGKLSKLGVTVGSAVSSSTKEDSQALTAEEMEGFVARASMELRAGSVARATK
jgi:hypothetical protein